MVTALIKRLRIQLILLTSVYCTAILIWIIVLIGTSYFLIYRFQLFTIFALLAVIGGNFFILNRIGSFRRQLRNLNRSIEQHIFGKRRLIIDSIAEFHSKRIYEIETAQIERELDSHTQLKHYVTENDQRFHRRMLAVGILIVVAIVFLFVILPSVSNKLSQVRQFWEFRPQWDIPDYYIEGKPLTLTLTNQVGQFDEVTIKIGKQVIASASGIFKLDETITSANTLNLRIYGTKFGVKRLLMEKKLIGTTRLLPNHISIAVIYPFKREEFSALQDLEVWKGARIQLWGTFTKTLTNMRLINAIPDSTEIVRNSFTLSFIPPKTGKYALEFISDDGDVYTSPEFMIKTVVNQPPVVRLIYPLQDLVLENLQWVLHSIIEAEDDQGVKSLAYSVTVTNRDPYLNYFYGENLQHHIFIDVSRYIRQNIKFSSAVYDLLPGDVASVMFTVTDVFNKSSDSVMFNIIAPDLSDITGEREKLQQQLYQSIKELSNTYEGFKQDLADKNMAGADSKASQMENQISNITKAISELGENYSVDVSDIEEIAKSLERLKEISEGLKHHSETMKKIAELMKQDNAGMQEFKMNAEDIPRMLDELEALLKNLEYYKKYSELVNQYHLLQQTYKALKQTGDNIEEFERKLEVYQKKLNQMGQGEFKSVNQITAELTLESMKLKMGNTQSFAKSDDLMSELGQKIQQLVQGAQLQQMQARIDHIERIIEELYLDQIVVRETMEIDPGTREVPQLANLGKIVENMNAVNYSLKSMETEIDKALEGLVFEGKARQQLENQLKTNRQLMNFLLGSLRDNQFESTRMSLSLLGNYTALITLYLIKINNALQSAMQNMIQSPQGMPLMSVMRLEDLLKMQGMMSQGLLKLQQQLLQSGQMSPEIKQKMEQLKKLQQEIQKNLNELLGNGDSLLEGGQEVYQMMGDIIKDLESYKVETETVEKSKQIEKKLLKSQKSLESKGVQKERKAETAKEYKANSPPSHPPAQLDKLELNKFISPNMSKYYQQIIENYLSTVKESD